MEKTTAKRDVHDIGFMESLMFGAKLAEIHTDFSSRVIKLAIEYGVDEMSAFALAVKVLKESVDDPMFADEILPILINEANEDEE